MTYCDDIHCQSGSEDFRLLQFLQDAGLWEFKKLHKDRMPECMKAISESQLRC